MAPEGKHLSRKQSVISQRRKKNESEHNEKNTYAAPPPRNPDVRTFPWFKISQKESVAPSSNIDCAVGEALDAFVVGLAVGFAEEDFRLGVEGFRVDVRVGAALLLDDGVASPT